MLKHLPMRTFLVILLAIVFGSAVAIYRTTHPSEGTITVANGVWLANKEMNMGEDKLLTAQIALGATFAIQPSEVIYMIAMADNKGNTLNSGQDYVIKGKKEWLRARYWSITLYGGDHFLIPNEIDKFSFNVANTQFEQDGSFKIHVSPTEKAGNWLPSGQEEKMFFLLRMYHPDKSVYKNIEQIELPDIIPVEAN